MIKKIIKGLFKPLSLFFVFIYYTTSYSDTGQISINAVVISGSRCTFQTKNATINLGNLIPGSGIDVSGSASLTFRCQGKSPLVYSITDDDGLWDNTPGVHRMKHTTLNEFINYNFTYTPSSETVTDPNPNRTITINRTLNITAIALHSSYQNAAVGNYSDTVTLTILP
ncbi:MAG: spore coat U domain-containing protein [Proteobacteria bacterium]|nr:spore coat U domain-containing protein [Pseudomonadota bacterium]